MNGELFGLAVQGLRRKKRSSLLLFLVLFLSFTFAIVSLNVTGSIRATNEEYLRETYGDWYAAIPAGIDGDEDWLRERDWLDGLGVCRSFGEIAAVAGGSRSIGTMDGAFLEMGRIGLRAGRFPEKAGEIAMEADLLSALGYDYTLGQELTFTVSVPAVGYMTRTGVSGTEAVDFSVPAERTYTLVGVLREYSDLWVRDRNAGGLPLNSAMILPEDAQALRQAARESFPELLKEEAETGLSALELKPTVPQYHLTVLPGAEERARQELTAYLSGERGTAAADRTPCVNSPVYGGGEEPGRTGDTFYAGVILAMTVLAVICIYAVRLRDEARQLAIFRSIGITKGQLCLMLLYETLCLGVPALVLGAAGGLAGTWLVLRLAVVSGSAPIRVAFPAGPLAAAAGLWLLGVAAARLAVFLAALRTPLTGRLAMGRKQARRNRLLRQGLTVVLTALLGAAVIFTALEALAPRSMMDTWDSYPDYTVSGGPETIREAGFREELERAAGTVRQIPGVKAAWVYEELEMELTFDGMEDVELANDYRDGKKGMVWSFTHPKESTVIHLLVIRRGDWTGTVDLEAAGVDKDRFDAGEAVLVSFPVTQGRDGFLVSARQTAKTYRTCGISAGDTIHVALARAGVEADAEVGGIQMMTPSMPNRMLSSMVSPYTVICSEAFLEKLEDQLAPGETFAQYYRADDANGVYYGSDGPYGYERIYVDADRNADHLSTDAALAGLCVREGFRLSNDREEYHAHVQEYLQRLILLFTGGGCAVLVLLLILWNSLAMEAEERRHDCGVLQAIGLSRRQLSLQLTGTALGRGLLAVALGWLGWLGAAAYSAASRHAKLLLQYADAPEDRPNGVPSVWELFREDVLGALTIYGRPAMIALLTGVILAAVLALSWFAQRRLFRDDLMEKLRDEH